MQQALALLIDEVAGPLTNEQKEYVSLTQRNLQRLHGLIDELLRLAEHQSKGG
jgi:signal transduction histidine kinase